MQLIAITDIFGKTEHFQKLIDDISSMYDSIEIIDPYEGVDNQFLNEEEAYEKFQEKMGLKKYSKILLQNLQRNGTNKQVVILGFSIGASAIWAISEKLKTTSTMKAICFYSSQIRNYLNVTPEIAIDLYFARNEPSYDVEEIMKSVSAKPKVRCCKTSYLHGFMNRLSKNYNQAGYDKYIHIIKNS